jgi:hypothetical protein
MNLDVLRDRGRIPQVRKMAGLGPLHHIREARPSHTVNAQQTPPGRRHTARRIAPDVAVVDIVIVGNADAGRWRTTSTKVRHQRYPRGSRGGFFNQ